VFDLDETLIKATNDKDKLPNGLYDVSCQLEVLGMMKRDIYISYRPYLFEMLDRLKKNFELILFTAGYDVYAETIINELQKNTKYFDVVLTREHCTQHPNGRY